MSTAINNNQSSIVILADFSDGSWHATSFAMQFLFNENSSLTLLQTYQDPGWGHLMMRKLSHHLKKITKNELRALKNKLLKHFSVEKQKINTLSIEGELNTVLNFEPLINSEHVLVLSTHNSFEDSCKRQNGCLENIIDTAANPLFILPEKFEGNSPKRILFVGNPDNTPSEQLCRQVLEICKRTKSDLEILFINNTQTQNIPISVQALYEEYFKEINTTIAITRNKTKCEGINNYLNNENRDLIVVEND